MKSLIRREVIETAETVVVKVGTNALSRDDDTLDEERIAGLARQIARIRSTGRQVVVVSSGAIGAGIGILKLKSRPKDLAQLQAAAATGQARLIRAYDDVLRQHDLYAAQLLLTAEDFKHRRRYLNVRNTLSMLFEYGVVPIVNENDTVSVEEIKFGDNDQLAAMVTSLLPRPLLVILSVVDGLYDGDPHDPASRRIPLVATWDEHLLGLARHTQSSRGTGGMKSKLEAVRTATAVGENVIIADGRQPHVLDLVLEGEEVGTLFLARDVALPAWKRWIGYTIRPKGQFRLDAGASQAVRFGGKSLLPIGIVGVVGSVQAGEVVSLADADGNEFARGLSNYDSVDVARIAGRRTDALAELLGRVTYHEVVHRDSLVVTA
ncbi:MAG: glutamate 5-kinase [Planctomycetaceae bacterium]